MLIVNKKKRHQNDIIDVFLVSLLLTLNIFLTFSTVSIVDFEQINVCWGSNIMAQVTDKDSSKG